MEKDNESHVCSFICRKMLLLFSWEVSTLLMNSQRIVFSLARFFSFPEFLFQPGKEIVRRITDKDWMRHLNDGIILGSRQPAANGNL
jgi:hypothetical protein